MPTFSYTLVDSFNSKPLSGNPAAVVVLDQESSQLFKRQRSTSTHRCRTELWGNSFRHSHPGLGYFIPPLRYPLVYLECRDEPVVTPPWPPPKLCSPLSKKLVEIPAGGRKLNFRGMTGSLEAKQLDDGRVGLSFPEVVLAPLSAYLPEDKVKKVWSIAQAALQDDTVKILDINRGATKTFEDWSLIELDLTKTDHQDLGKLKVNLELVVCARFPTLHRFLICLPKETTSTAGNQQIRAHYTGNTPPLPAIWITFRLPLHKSDVRSPLRHGRRCRHGLYELSPCAVLDKKVPEE